MTVRPDDIHFARRVHFSRGKRDRGTNASIWQTESHHRDSMGGTPTCASICGDEGRDEKIETRETINWHNHGPVRLHEGLPTDAKRLVGGRLSRSPRQSAVGRSAHLDQIA